MNNSYFADFGKFQGDCPWYAQYGTLVQTPINFLVINPEAHSEFCQTSKIECFAKMVNTITVFGKHSILDV